MLLRVAAIPAEPPMFLLRVAAIPAEPPGTSDVFAAGGRDFIIIKLSLTIN